MREILMMLALMLALAAMAASGMVLILFIGRMTEKAHRDSIAAVAAADLVGGAYSPLAGYFPALLKQMVDGKET